LAIARSSQVTIVRFTDRTELIQETLLLNEALTLEILITILVIIRDGIYLRANSNSNFRIIAVAVFDGFIAINSSM